MVLTEHVKSDAFGSKKGLKMVSDVKGSKTHQNEREGSREMKSGLKHDFELK